MASSPHASLNRPTRLVAESHQSLGKHMKKKETRADRGKEKELVSEVELRSCWADAGGGRERGENDGVMVGGVCESG